MDQFLSSGGKIKNMYIKPIQAQPYREEPVYDIVSDVIIREFKPDLDKLNLVGGDPVLIGETIERMIKELENKELILEIVRDNIIISDVTEKTEQEQVPGSAPITKRTMELKIPRCIIEKEKGTHQKYDYKDVIISAEAKHTL